MLVEADLQGLFVAADKLSGYGAGEVGGLIGGAGSQAEGVLPGGNFQSLRLDAAQAVEHHQALLRSAVQGARQRQRVVDPNRERSVLELMPDGQLHRGERDHDLFHRLRRGT